MSGRGTFAIYCVGAVFAGLGFGIAQHLRFAAAEVAAPEARARAIALVMAGGVLAAIIGPEIVKRTNMLLPPLMFLGTYLCITILPLISATLLLFIHLPPAVRQASAPVPFRAIIARRIFLTAVVCSMVGYGTMNLIMASTPLQMLFCGFGVNASADVIRAHSIAMFLPGFVTGRLIQRFGAHPIICIGALLTALCVATNLLLHPGARDLHGGAGAARRRLELHVRRRHHAAGDRARSARAGAGSGHQRLHRVRHRRVHRVRLRRDRGDRRLGGAEPGGAAADRDRGGAGDLALVGACAAGAGGGSVGRRRRAARRRAGWFGPKALKRPILPNSCCRNDASVPGEGVERATTVTGIESSWFSFFTSCSTPWSLKLSTTTFWLSTPCVRPIRGWVTSLT